MMVWLTESQWKEYQRRIAEGETQEDAFKTACKVPSTAEELAALSEGTRLARAGLGDKASQSTMPKTIDFSRITREVA